MAAQTVLFRCRSDNFGVLIRDTATGAVAAIDAPETAAIEAELQKAGWKLTDILVTHHHADHTDGIADLKAKYKCRVVAPRAEAQKSRWSTRRCARATRSASAICPPA